jgi:hypothetical protein
MTQPNAKGNGTPLPESSLARVVKLKPGSTNEASIKAVLPPELYGANYGQIIDYVLQKPDMNRKETRITDRVRNEMGNNYGIVANAGPASAGDEAKGAFKEAETPTGMKYLELEIIVAAEQEAGYLRSYRPYM